VVHPDLARAGLEKSGHADSTWSCVSRTPNREVSMSTSLLYHAFGIRGYHYFYSGRYSSIAHRPRLT
jgi:hypothetical protein